MLNLFSLAKLAYEHPEAETLRVAEFAVGGKWFPFNSRPGVMGVVNLSSDSWYRESVCLTAEAAVRRGLLLKAQGADLVDVGAESTLAHAARVEDALQASSLVPVVVGLASQGVIVSVETYHPSVARACLEAGAAVLNLTGTEHACQMYELAAQHQATVILCYVQGRNVREVQEFSFSADPVALMYDYFARQIEAALREGVSRIIIDPGLGFYYRNLQDSSTRVRHQMNVFLNTFRLRKLGYPTCHALPHAFEFFGEEVRCAEPFFAVLAAMGKTDLFRTHEVPRVRAVLDTMRTFEPA
jgi:dihydropteroate synthase